MSAILGIGGYVPERVVKNSDLEKILDTTDEWIQQRTGIQERHWVTADQATSDLCLQASRIALENAKLTEKDIDCIIVATSTPDHDVPGSAPFLQRKMNLANVPAFEIRQACSGFLYGLLMADSFIKTGAFKKVLLVGAEVQSKVLDMTSEGRGVSVIFADGAGAVVMGESPSQSSGVLSVKIHADGRYAEELSIASPGSALGPQRLTPEMLSKGQHYLHMNGKLVFMHAVTKMPEVLNESLTAAKVSLGDIDHFFFHQANIRINEKIADDMKIEPQKIHNTIHKFGNTTAATIPLGMYDAFKDGKLKKGDLMALTAFGAGFTWGSAIVRF
jgi:3-oxoacyl-[acyl-carrier-protein] synthase-3